MGRRYLGFAFLLATWLIVLSVPSLRVMFQRQTDELLGLPARASASDTDRDYPWPQSQFFRTPPDVGWLTARYPGDVRVLAKVLEWQAVQKRDELWSFNETTTEASTAETTIAPPPEFYNKRYNSQRLLARDIRRAYDRLIARFPDTAWLIANRLRETMRGSVPGRPVNEPEINPNAISSWKQEPWLARDDLRDAISIAKQGQRLEPDNTFFDWCLAAFYFGLYREADALRTLEQASHKPRYDDHTHKDLQVSLDVRRLMHPLLLEDKLAASAAVLFPHLASHNQVARLATWESIKAERAGDHQRALQIDSSVARLGATLQKATWLITGQVGVAMQSRAWGSNPWRSNPWRTPQGSPLEEDLYGSKASQEEVYRRLLDTANRFADYAAAHGRADLAREARRQGTEAVSFRRQTQLYVSEMYAGFVTKGNFKTAANLWWAGVSLLGQLLVCALVWLVLSLLAWRVRHHGNAAIIADVSWSDRASRLLIISCVTVSLAVAAIRLGAGWLEWDYSYNSQSEDARRVTQTIPTLRWLIVFLPPLCAAVLCLAAAGWRYRKEVRAAGPSAGAPARDHEDEKQLNSVLGPVALPIFAASTALTLGTIAAWVAVLFGDDEPSAVARWLLCLLLSALAAAREIRRWQRLSNDKKSRLTFFGNRLLTWSTVFFWLLLLAGMFVAFDEVPTSWTNFLIHPALTILNLLQGYTVVLALLLTLLCLLRWGAHYARSTPPPVLRVVAALQVFWTRDTVRAMFVLGSVLYVILLLASLPARHTAERNLDILINRGERALMTQRSALR